MRPFIDKIRKFNISPTELSKKSGLSVDKIQSFMEGLAEPSIVELRGLSKALRVSVDYLITDSAKYQKVQSLFRKAEYTSNDIYADRVSYIFSNLVSIVDIYPYTFSWRQIFPAVNNSHEGAYQLATIFRSVFFEDDIKSPITSLARILAEDLNCIILVIELGGLEGASAIINGVPYILLSPRFIPRMLFTLAHELGHILAHHHDANNFAIIDNNAFSFSTRSSNEEAFAHAFASELLLPRLGIGIALRSIRSHIENAIGKKDVFGELEIIYLSRFFGVSFEVAALRCENLGLIPPGSANSLYRAIVKQHKNPEVRAEELNLPAREPITMPKMSDNLLRIVVRRISDGSLSLGQACEVLSISSSELFELNRQANGDNT